jgi:peptidoglycan/LPS O-acetylase OafA/YrhL
MHLFFVQSWTPGEVRQNFNGPSWSVSLEVLLYVLFFVACRFGLRARGAAVVALAAVPLYWLNIDLARAPIGFFMGGATVWAWQALRDQAGPVARRTILGAAVLAWTVLYVALYRGWFDSGDDNVVFLALFDFGLAPLTVLALALREHVRPAAGWLGALGDISYATYLLQFPLQLALALLAARLALTPQFFMQGWVMLVFFAVLIALGFASYHLFERPLQARLRTLRYFGKTIAARG